MELDQGRLSRIAGWMQGYVDRRQFPGCSVLIAQGGQENYFHACGLRDVENELSFERDSLVRIYSMTKPITSVAIMILMERGQLHLDMPVSAFIPEFANCTALVPGAERIDQVEAAPTPTLHQLLVHTSGLTYGFNPGVLSQEMDAQKLAFAAGYGTLAEQAAKVAALPLAFQPGTRWEYSVATDILGRVVEVVSGKTLDVFFQEEIFEPLGMSDTGFALKDADVGRFASLYTPLSGNPMAIDEVNEGGETLRLVDHADKTPWRRVTCLSGGGGLIGTIDDYLRFAEMIRRGGALEGARILSSATVRFMCRNHLPGEIAAMGPQSFAEQPMEGTGFGLGGSVVLDPARARTPGSVGDFSWGGMASTFFWVDREMNLSAVFFTQLTPSSSYPARAELKALVHGALL